MSDHLSSTMTSSHSTAVTLTSLRYPYDTRKIPLSSHEPCIIGRASRTDAKGLQATPDNALFDCPVVSRIHAELRLNPSSTSASQLVVVDMSSTHGTSVNNKRLVAEQPFELRSGDQIKLGDRVARGPDVHDGVLLRFDIATPGFGHGSQLGSQTYETYGRGFHVPSEDEDSYDDEISVISMNENGHSSAQTTPEQPKACIGSQQEPIDLDKPTASLRDIIYLEDDCKRSGLRLCGGGQARAAEAAEMPIMVEDSLDKDAEVLAADSIRDVPFQRTSLSEMLNPVSTNPADADDNGSERSIEDESGLGAMDEYDCDRDADEGAENLYDSEASDILDNGSDAETEAESHDSPGLLVRRKQPSPELGSQDTFEAPAIPPPHQDEVHYSVPTTRYDPVRGSQPPQQAAVPQKPRVTYTYDSYARGHAYEIPATDYCHSSRWDVMPPPPPPPATTTNPADITFSNSSVPRGTLDGQGFPAAAVSYGFDATYYPSTTAYQSNQSPFVPWGVAPETPSETIDTNSPAARAPFKAPCDSTRTTSSSKSKISIPQLVEDAVSTSQPKVSSPKPRGSKRKAQNISEKNLADDELLKVSAHTVNDSLADMTVNSQHLAKYIHAERPTCQTAKVKRPRKKTKLASATQEAAKYGVGAAVGVVGAFGFLCSPLAEKLITWLA